MVELKIKKDDEEITLVDKEDINAQYSINVEKQSTADTGFFSTYVIKQNDTQKGVKINIPKDFLIKSATVETCTTANSPVSGYEVGDKYIDLIINSKDSTDTDEHLYLATKEIGAYPVDEVTLTVDNGKLAVKNNGITWAKLATAVQNTINGKEDASNKVNSVSASSTNTQYPSAKCVYDTFCEGNDLRLSDSRNPKFTDIGGTSTNPKDLNNYTTGGFYYCGSDANAPYVSNCPLTSTRNKSFFLLVETWGESSNYVKQTLTYYIGESNTYIRIKKGSAWDVWRRVQTSIGHMPTTHTSSTSAWTATSSEIVSLTHGTVIILFLKQEPTTSPVTLDLTLANGDTTGAKNVYFDSSTRLSNQYKKTSMIGLYYSGTEWFVINPHVTPASNAPLPLELYPNAGSSDKYAREDHVHSFFDYIDNGTSGSAGYTKIIQFKVNNNYQDTPIKVDIAQRRFKKQQTINIMFATGATSNYDPMVESLIHDGSNNDIYMYKESTSTWSLIVKKLDSYDSIRVKVNNPNPGITVSNLNTHLSSLPTSTTANKLIKSENYIESMIGDINNYITS